MGCLFCINFTQLSLSWIEVIECNYRLLCPCTILRAYIWVCASVATDVVAFFISHYLLPRHEPYFLLFTVNVAYSRCTRGTVQRCSSSLEAKFEGSPNTASGDNPVKSVWVDHCPLFNFDNQRPIAVTGRDYFFFSITWCLQLPSTYATDYRTPVPPCLTQAAFQLYNQLLAEQIGSHPLTGIWGGGLFMPPMSAHAVRGIGVLRLRYLFVTTDLPSVRRYSYAFTTRYTAAIPLSSWPLLRM